MKNRRFLSLVLSICLVMSLFTGFAGTASADGEVINYTVQSGDYLFKVCQRLGLDYYQCKNAIMILNGFGSEAQLNRISVGQNIKLPATNAIAATVKTGTTTTTTTTIGTTTTTTTTTSTVVSGLVGNDKIAYYLVPHTMTYGETINSVCNSIGSSYSAYAETIKSINGLANINSVAAGKVIYFPVNTAPSGTYYVVVAHYVQSGETMTSICSKYGVSYLGNYKMVTGLNKNANLNYISVGQTVYVPALSSIVYSSSSSVVPVNPNPTPAPVISTGNKINFTATTDGEPYATVKGIAVTAAEPGTEVTIVPNALYGYAQETLSVGATNGTVIQTVGNTFIMPSSDVAVTVNYAAGKAISRLATIGGSCQTLVDGAAVSSAIYGKTVNVVPMPNNGYEVSSVTYSYWSTLTGERISKEVPNRNGGYLFTMPDAATIVSVTFQPATTYKLSMSSMLSNGGANCMIDNAYVTRASAGKTVYVKAWPVEGYVLKDVIVKDSSDAPVKVEMDGEKGASFVMPAKAVTVLPVFTNANYYSIATVATVDGTESWAGGSAAYFVNGNQVGAAREGDVVTIVTYPNGGYTQDLNDTKVRLANSSADVTSLEKTRNTFTMPAGNVVVTVDFTPGAYYISFQNVDNYGQVTAAINEIAVNNAQKGDEVEIVLKPYNANYIVDESTLHVTYIKEKNGVYTNVDSVVGAGIVAKLTSFDYNRYFFTIPYNPDENISGVTVRGGFKVADTKKIELKSVEIYNPDTDTTAALAAADLAKFANVSFLLDGVKVDNCVPGNTVKINTTVKNGASIRTIYANGNEVKAENGTYSFVMPNKDTDVKVVLELAKFNISRSFAGTITILEDPVYLPKHYGFRVSNAEPGIDVKEFQAYADDPVKFKVAPPAGYAVDKVAVLTGDLEPVEISAETSDTYSFKMPACDVAIKVTYVSTTYALTKAAATHGSFTLTVGEDAAATQASKGDTVKVMLSPETGYEVDTVTATGAAPVKSTDGTYYYFTMPGSAVTVTVTFKLKAYTLTAKAVDDKIGKIEITAPAFAAADIISTAGTGTTVITGVVGNALKDAIAKVKFGETVKAKITVVAADKAALDTDAVFVNGTKAVVTGTSPNYEIQFTMPAADVEITAKFLADEHNVTTSGIDASIIDISSLPAKAAYGTTVSFKLPTYDTAATVLPADVTSAPAVALTYDKNTGSFSFVMPDSDVDFTAKASYGVSIWSNGAGTSSVVNAANESIKYAKAGDIVTIVAQSYDNNKLQKFIFRDIKNNEVVVATTPVPGTNNYTFTMPAYSVTIEAVYIWYSAYNVVVPDLEALGFNTDQFEYVNVNGQIIGIKGGVAQVAAGDMAYVGFQMKPGLAVDSSAITFAPVAPADVKYTTGNNSITFNFKMPSQTVAVGGINVINQTLAEKTFYSVLNGGCANGTLTFATDTTGTPALELNSVVTAGEKVTVIVTPNDGYELDGTTFKLYDASWRELNPIAVTQTGNKFEFNMPQDSVIVTVSCVPVNSPVVRVIGMPGNKQIEYVDVAGYKTFWPATDPITDSVAIPSENDVTVTIVMKEGFELNPIADLNSNTKLGGTAQTWKIDKSGTKLAYTLKITKISKDLEIDFDAAFAASLKVEARTSYTYTVALGGYGIIDPITGATKVNDQQYTGVDAATVVKVVFNSTYTDPGYIRITDYVGNELVLCTKNELGVLTTNKNTATLTFQNGTSTFAAGDTYLTFVLPASSVNIELW